jgi:Xaa-Pro dipeptidase
MLHFTTDEFAARMARARAAMAERGLDGMLLFAPESQYWLTGYDTFGYCFFQCLVIGGAEPALLTRSADLRQAQLTSTIPDIRIWVDRAGATPADDLARMLRDLGLAGKRLGVETDTHGLTAANGRKLAAALDGVAALVEASDLVPTLRLVKSEAEIACIRQAAALSDAAFDAALGEIRPGADESAILAALQGAVFAGGGDYPANPAIIGSGAQALLCRYASGRRTLSTQDQITLEWAGVWRHYHAPMMATVPVGPVDPRHWTMHAAATAALLAAENALRPGNTLGAVFDAHAQVLDAAGFGHARLNACGYAVGARYAPSWMEPAMIHAGNPTVIEAGMTFFLHMILMDSDAGLAMCPGRTSLVTPAGAEPLSRHTLDLRPG